ncbi:MAG: helix-turn-helix domain-containing protein [Cyanophyceae cyanobacterium]
MKPELVQDLDEFQSRLEKLFKETLVTTNPNVQHLLANVYKELGQASEKLLVASEEILAQSQQLKTLQSQLNRERYLLGNEVNEQSHSILVTNEQGVIQQASSAVGYLLNIEPRFLLNKPVETFFTPRERRLFPFMMQKLCESQQIQRWTVEIQPRHCRPIVVLLRAVPVRGQDSTIRWSFTCLSSSQRSKNFAYPHRNTQSYRQGEIVSLQSPELLWVVRAGIVKLSTTSETGEEVLLGLVGPNMPFGAALTALPIYQATALSETVELIPLSQLEIERRSLLPDFMPQLIQRLQQTEILLAISGKRHVQERLDYLLQWLKEHFGQPHPQGIRLSIRLTHQDLADACCTTRVTISRLIGKLKQQGKIAYDSEYNIVLLSEGKNVPEGRGQGKGKIVAFATGKEHRTKESAE